MSELLSLPFRRSDLVQFHLSPESRHDRVLGERERRAGIWRHIRSYLITSSPGLEKKIANNIDSPMRERTALYESPGVDNHAVVTEPWSRCLTRTGFWVAAKESRDHQPAS